MFSNSVKGLLNASIRHELRTQVKSYTVIVERYKKPNINKKEVDQRKRNLRSENFHLKFVDCLHQKPWGNIDLILTQYVEGVGHKGEIVNVSRHDAYYHLLPTQKAVYVTEEFLEKFKKDREELVNKPKVSPYAIKTKEELEKMTLEIPMNMSVDWKLTENNIRIALRYNKVMSTNESILIPAGLEITKQDKNSYKEPFYVQIRVNDYVTAQLKCQIVPVNLDKLWEEFATFHKTV